MKRRLIQHALAAALVVAALVAWPALPGAGRAWAEAPVLTQARAQYDAANFDGAVKLLRDALAAGEVKGADQIAAKELLGRCMVKSGDRLQAKELFKSLLRQKPGARLDPRTVPPEEIEVFNMAQAEVRDEQIETGRRVPASLAFYFGTGSGENRNMGDLPAAGGGPNTFDVKPFYGGSVRFPVSPRLSLELEMQRLRATAADTFPETIGGRFEITGLPISLSLYHATLVHPKWRVNTFVGAGAVVPATSTLFFYLFGERATISDEKSGLYGHAGLEGEFLASPRFAFTARVLGRYAKVKGFYEGSTLKIWGTTALADRSVDFSGFGAQVGVRAYIGY